MSMIVVIRRSHKFAPSVRLTARGRGLSVAALSLTMVLLVEWLSDFPVKAEGISYASDAPAVSFADGIDLPCAGFQSAGKHFIRIRNGEDHSNGSSADRSGNRAAAVWRFLV